jgi:hypothetical protein
MRSCFASRGLLLTAVVSVGCAAACAATGTADSFTENVGASNPTEPTPPASLPARDDPATDVPVDAGEDAGKDAGKEAGAKDGSVGPLDAGADVWAPDPGEPCPVANAIVKRSCGLCGTEEAVCLADPDGGSGGTVSAYGPCYGQVQDGCVPGTTTTEACGNCGTLTKTCSKFCGWSTSACQQPPNTCTPTTHEYTKAGCGADTYRTHECTSACTWTNYSATCGPLDFELTVASTVGAQVSGIYPLTASLAGKRLTGACPTGTLSTTTKHPHQYVELVNKTDKVIVASVWNAQAPGGPIIDTMMASYAGSNRPGTDAERKACQKGAEDACPSGLGCTDSFAGLRDVSIPAFGSTLIWFGSYYEASGFGSSEGDVKLVVRTDSVH